MAQPRIAMYQSLVNRDGTTTAISAAFSTRCGVETVMADNLLIKVEFLCDRIFMRLKRA
jgi:hypothetical protein